MLGGKARKAIRVPKSLMFLHEKFIALFLTPLQVIKTAKIKGDLPFLGYFLPTRFAEEPYFLAYGF
jgi:hypothetical protein